MYVCDCLEGEITGFEVKPVSEGAGLGWFQLVSAAALT